MDTCHGIPKRLSVADFLMIVSQSDLKALGSFRELTHSLNEMLGIRLRLRSWSSLYHMLRRMQATSRHSTAHRAAKAGPLATIDRARLLFILERCVSPKGPKHNQSAGESKLSRAIDVISETAMDPKVRYQLTKTRNFVHSSRLEGISLRPMANQATLEEILHKHRK